MKKNIINFRKALKYLLILIGLFSFSIGLDAQEDTGKNHGIYLSYGNIIFSSQASIAFEKVVRRSGKNITKGKLNFGHYFGNHADYGTGEKLVDNHFSLSVVQLINKLELNAGLAYTQYTLSPGFDPVENVDYYNEKRKDLRPFVNLGLRFENEAWAFRFGVGNLELAYVGFGVVF